MENKELAVGEIGVIDGVKVQCVKDRHTNGCHNLCAFRKESCFHRASLCSSRKRTDNTSVYFKKIEDNGNK